MRGTTIPYVHSSGSIQCNMVMSSTIASVSTLLCIFLIDMNHVYYNLFSPSFLYYGFLAGMGLLSLCMQGYVYSRASKITGIESNEEFCKLQQEIVARYHLSDRVQVVHSDVCLQAELLQSADLIILNNVFEFFCSLEEQARC